MVICLCIICSIISEVDKYTTCQLLKLYYKLYRDRLPSYFEMFLPEYGAHRHNLRNDLIRLPAIRCEFGEMNAKYQMQLRLRDLASPANPPKYPSIHINEDTLSTSIHRFSSYLKMKFVNFYPNMCNLEGCFNVGGRYCHQTSSLFTIITKHIHHR